MDDVCVADDEAGVGLVYFAIAQHRTQPIDRIPAHVTERNVKRNAVELVLLQIVRQLHLIIIAARTRVLCVGTNACTHHAIRRLASAPLVAGQAHLLALHPLGVKIQQGISRAKPVFTIQLQLAWLLQALEVCIFKAAIRHQVVPIVLRGRLKRRQHRQGTRHHQGTDLQMLNHVVKQVSLFHCCQK